MLRVARQGLRPWPWRLVGDENTVCFDILKPFLLFSTSYLSSIRREDLWQRLQFSALLMPSSHTKNKTPRKNAELEWLFRSHVAKDCRSYCKGYSSAGLMMARMGVAIMILVLTLILQIYLMASLKLSCSLMLFCCTGLFSGCLISFISYSRVLWLNARFLVVLCWGKPWSHRWPWTKFGMSMIATR